MKRLFLLALSVIATFSVSVFVSSAADEQIDKSDVGAYMTMYRGKIDVLGGHSDETSLSLVSTKALATGLNKLAADGWELFAIEPGRTVPLTGPAGSTKTYQPVYVFRKRQ